MKMQQRPFVVEVKSSRRRQKSTNKSIWESTDLKALIRAAETETGELFGRETDVTISGESAGVEQDTHSVPSTTAVADTEQSNPPDDFSLPIIPLVEAQSLINHDGGNPVTLAKRVTSPRLARVRQPKGKRILPVGDTGNARGEPWHVIEHSRTDELSVLENENRRLKDLLRQRLIEENNTLRNMLQRNTPSL